MKTFNSNRVHAPRDNDREVITLPVKYTFILTSKFHSSHKEHAVLYQTFFFLVTYRQGVEQDKQLAIEMDCLALSYDVTDTSLLWLLWNSSNFTFLRLLGSSHYCISLGLLGSIYFCLFRGVKEVLNIALRKSYTRLRSIPGDLKLPKSRTRHVVTSPAEYTCRKDTYTNASYLANFLWTSETWTP